MILCLFPSRHKPDMAANTSAFIQHSSASTKVHSPAEEEAMPANITKRLTSELMTLMMGDQPGISAFPASENNMAYWTGQITGPEGTVYEGLSFKISLHFPPKYPYQAPTVRFESPCYHPNVDTRGNICLDILQEKWSAVLSVSSILVSLQSLLGEPNNQSPLNVDAANLWSDAKTFKAELMKTYRPIEDA